MPNVKLTGRRRPKAGGNPTDARSAAVGRSVLSVGLAFFSGEALPTFLNPNAGKRLRISRAVGGNAVLNDLEMALVFKHKIYSLGSKVRIGRKIEAVILREFGWRRGFFGQRFLQHLSWSLAKAEAGRYFRQQRRREINEPTVSLDPRMKCVLGVSEYFARWVSQEKLAFKSKFKRCRPRARHPFDVVTDVQHRRAYDREERAAFMRIRKMITQMPVDCSKHPFVITRRDEVGGAHEEG